MSTITLGITCWDKDIHYLPNLLNLIKKQTIQPDEIIVVANNIKNLTVGDEIKSFSVAERKPVSWSRNKCAELATKDIVIFFDVDDIPHPQKIEITKNIFENTDADCLVHGFTENGPTTDVYNTFEYYLITELIIPQGYLKSPTGSKDVHHGHLAIKRDITHRYKYNENLGFYERGFQFWGEDSAYCNQLFISGHNFYYTPHKLINYRPSYQDLTRKWYHV
jgi:glycosyltransferase involved in cell wall biosynthesis